SQGPRTTLLRLAREPAGPPALVSSLKPQPVDDLAELRDILKVSIDGSKPDIGDRIDTAQRFDDPLADNRRRDLALAGIGDLPLDILHNPLQRFGAHRPLHARQPQPAQDLLPLERLAPAPRPPADLPPPRRS